MHGVTCTQLLSQLFHLEQLLHHLAVLLLALSNSPSLEGMPALPSLPQMQLLQPMPCSHTLKAQSTLGRCIGLPVCKDLPEPVETAAVPAL